MVSIEFEVWPPKVVERLQQAEQALRRQGLPASVIRAILVELLQTYEGISAEDSEALAMTVIPDHQARAEPEHVQERLRQASEQSPRSTDIRLRRLTSKELGIGVARGNGKIAQNLPRLQAGLAGLGYVPTPRSIAVFQHPSSSNRRIVIKQQVIRFERKDGRRSIGVPHKRPWQLEQSFRISSQVDEALAMAKEHR